MSGGGAFELDLIGSFRLVAPDGSRIHISAKRSRILLAMLATSKSGERSRRWLQERIWGSRERANSQASLRRELSNLRPLVNLAGRSLLVVKHETVALDLDQVTVDVRDPKRVIESRGDFLEGIDIAWEEGFEDWLREERQVIETTRDTHEDVGIAPLANSAAAASSGSAKISIVVHGDAIPFEHATTIDRIADVLAERIARLRWLPLVGAPATKSKIDGPADLLRLGKSLGVEYLLHCQFNQDETATIALSQASSARMLWSGRRALKEGEGPCDPERIANDTIAAIAAKIEADQAEKVRSRPVEQLVADELLWRARWHMRRLNRNDASVAGELLERAAEKQPGSVNILVEQARSQVLNALAAGAPEAELKVLRKKVVLARDIDPHDARIWLLLGVLDLWLRRHDSAAALMHEAIRLEPSLSVAYGHLGSCYIFSGQPADGLRLVNNALRLNPADAQAFFQFGKLSLGNFMAGTYDQAVQHANAALARRPGYVHGHIYKIASLSMKSDVDELSGAMSALRNSKPNFAPSVIDRLPFRDPAWNAKLRSIVESAPV